MKLTLRDLCEITEQKNPTFFNRVLKSKVVGLRSRKNFKRFIFHVKSKMIYSDPKGHLVTILFPNLTAEELKKNKNLLPIDTRVRCWCTCPAWRLWGSAYNSTNQKYNLQPFSESRSPDKRDPDRKNLVCKHVYAVYRDIRYDNFIRLYNRFKQAYYRKNKKKSSEAEDMVLMFIYYFLVQKGLSKNDAILKLSDLISSDNVETFLKENNLII